MSAKTFLLALSLLLIIEGLGPALVPEKWRRYLQEVARLAPGQLRTVGVVMILAGAVLFHFSK